MPVNTSTKRPPIAAMGLLLAAAVLMATASNAGAAEKIRLGVAGSATQYFGLVNNDDNGTGDFSGFDVKSDSEIGFGGDTTLDNGLRFGAEVILKAETAGDDQIDGTYLWNEGDHGRIEIGQADSAAVAMHHAAPDVGLGINDSDIGDWITNPSGGDENSGFRSTFLYLGDDKATKLTWFSPQRAGLQLGISYIPDFERDDNGQPNGDTAYRDTIAVGLNYTRQFGGGGEFALSGGFVTANSPDGIAGGSGAEAYSVGFNLKIDALTIGGSYASTKGNPSGGDDTETSLDGSGFDIGVAYAFDPTTVSLSYYSGEVEDAVATVGDSTHETIMASLSYQMGPGVALIASLFHSRFEADSGVKNDGTALIAGMVLEF
jgi:outer membrane protein OmpU